MKRTMITMAAVATSALALAACGSTESIGGNASTGSSENGQTTLVVGSQDYYSNEIIAEAVWANPGLAGIAYWQYFDTRTCGRECTQDGKKHVAMSFAGLFDCYRRPKRAVRTLTDWFRGKTPANLATP